MAAAKKTAAPSKPPAPPKKRAPAKKTAAKKTAPAKPEGFGPPPEMGTPTQAPAKEKAPARARPPAPPKRPDYAKGEMTETRTVGRKPQDAAKRFAQAKGTAGSYHRMILAEFVLCLLLAVLGGILNPRKSKDGIISFVHVLVQLTAICLLFFILALLSSGERVGKVAAAFGGLVTLGVLLNSTPAIKAIGKIFAPGSGTGASAGTGILPAPAGDFTSTDQLGKSSTGT